MRFVSDSLGLSGAAFALLRDLIHDRTGLCYPDGRSSTLADKLSERVVACGFDSFLDYYYLLKYDESAGGEWQHVVDALSVQETYFWREGDQIRALVDVIVPHHFQRGSTGPLSIWSAACASGEEPLSIAMALDMAGWFGRAPIEIHGTDASLAAIERARAGLYGERSFRILPPELRQRYFSGEPGGQRVAHDLHARIKWATVNLVVDEVVKTLAEASVIFCRNVFIYFSDASMRKVVDTFARHMPSPGYLFLGASESLLRLATSFELEEVNGAFVYVKR